MVAFDYNIITPRTKSHDPPRRATESVKVCWGGFGVVVEGSDFDGLG